MTHEVREVLVMGDWPFLAQGKLPSVDVLNSVSDGAFSFVGTGNGHLTLSSLPQVARDTATLSPELAVIILDLGPEDDLEALKLAFDDATIALREIGVKGAIFIPAPKNPRRDLRSVSDRLSDFLVWMKRALKVYGYGLVDLYQRPATVVEMQLPHLARWAAKRAMKYLTAKSSKIEMDVVSLWQVDDFTDVEFPSFFTQRGRLGLKAISERVGAPPIEIANRVLGLDTRHMLNAFRPDRIKPWSLPVVASDVQDGLAYLELEGGRRFFGFQSGEVVREIYSLLVNFLPRVVREECFRLAVDVASRYQDGNRGLKQFINPGGTVMEVGAFLGFKAIAFAETAGAEGTVVAIELDPSNHDVLRRNVDINNLEDRIICLNRGAWNKRGWLRQFGAGQQQMSLVRLKHKDSFRTRNIVRTETLANIMDDHDLPFVDLINVQVNGAEIETLQGLENRSKDVGVIRIVSTFSREGVRNYDVCKEMVLGWGFRLLSQSNRNVIMAAGPGWHHDA